jgi:large subunit ribosomal protein L29
MKAKEQVKQLKGLGVAELSQELIASLREQFNLRMQHATKQLGQTHHLREVRRKIARIHTMIQEKTTG